MAEDPTLAAFQAALLDLLARDIPLAEILQALDENSAFAPYRDYVASFEPRMVEVAAALVKKWDQRQR